MSTLWNRRLSSFVAYPTWPSPSDHQSDGKVNWGEKSILQHSNKVLNTPLDQESRRMRGSSMPQRRGEDGPALENAFESVDSSAGDVSARRERGKLAQRAFRQRQIDMIRDLKDENARLKKAIANISTSVLMGQGQFQDAIDEACRITSVSHGSSSRYILSSPSYNHEDHGPSSEESRPASEEPLQNTTPVVDYESYTWPGNHMCGQNFMNDLGPPALVEGQFLFDTSEFTSYISSDPGSFVGAMPQMPPISMPEMQNQLNAQVSPHLHAHTNMNGAGDAMSPTQCTSNLCFHTAGRSRTQPDGHASMASPASLVAPGPPGDILPYLGATAYTVAGQTFWQTLRYGLHILNTFEQSQPTPSSDVVAIIYSLFHIDARHDRSFTAVKDHIAHRLTFREHAPSLIDREMTTSAPHNAEHHGGPVFRHTSQLHTTGSERSPGQSLNIPLFSPAADPSLGSLAPLSPMMESLTVEGTKLARFQQKSYLNPFRVDERLRQILGDAFLKLQINIAAGGMDTTLSSANQNHHTDIRCSAMSPLYTSATKQMLHTLASQATFFADGPRWHADTVANTAQIWMDSSGGDRFNS